ncbi:MAG: hypothetical protein KQH57_06385 [Actinomycetales bacterium]|nr:hypothetical protein [Actinomycetales bacterium]
MSTALATALARLAGLDLAPEQALEAATHAGVLDAPADPHGAAHRG